MVRANCAIGKTGRSAWRDRGGSSAYARSAAPRGLASRKPRINFWGQTRPGLGDSVFFVVRVSFRDFGS